MASKKILVVEDDPKTSASIALYLRHGGFEVVSADDGKAGLAMAREARPDLIVLDLMLPQLDGMSICRLLRTESSVPIIMLTARSTEDDKLRGLDTGADDYITKPFSPRELVARVRAVLRRSSAGDVASFINAGDVEVDAAAREVIVAGRPVTLTATEFRLLQTLAGTPSRVFTREELVARAFPDDYDGLDRTVDVHIKNLRRKLDDEPGLPSRIATVFGTGYRFVPR
jgi:DNA-binding response OmpR family regulator